MNSPQKLSDFMGGSFFHIIFFLLMTYAGVGNQGVGQAKILVVNQDQGGLDSYIVDRLHEEKGLFVVDQIDGSRITEAQG